MPTHGLGILVGGSRFGDPRTDELQHSCDILDLDAVPFDATPEPERVRLDFLAHGFAPHPRRSEAVLLEKRGPGGCLVDLAARRFVRPIAPMPGHHFYGHGTFTRDADALLAVETDLETGDGHGTALRMLALPASCEEPPPGVPVLWRALPRGARHGPAGCLRGRGGPFVVHGRRGLRRLRHARGR